MENKLFAFIGLLVICLILAWRVDEMNPAIQYKEHIVEQGETLWEIAERSDLVSSDKADVNDVIALMDEVQDIDSDITPGDVILVPYLK